MSNESMSFQQWAAKLGQPSVELRVQDDHVVVEEDGELIASGALSSQDDRWGGSAVSS